MLNVQRNPCLLGYTVKISVGQAFLQTVRYLSHSQ